VERNCGSVDKEKLQERNWIGVKYVKMQSGRGKEQLFVTSRRMVEKISTGCTDERG
jgi:hypothetical protein